MEKDDLMKMLQKSLGPSSAKAKKPEQSELESVINNASESFFPQIVRSPVLVMTSRKMPEDDIPTVILGTVTEGFTPEMFAKDVEVAKEHFKNPKNFYEVQMIPVKGAQRSLDSKDAITKIEKTIADLNKDTDSKTLRVIRIGIASTVLQTEAIIFLIKQWKCPAAEKCVQFVIAGDSEDNEMTTLCKLLLLNEEVKEIVFYNTQDYHPFGKVKSCDTIASSGGVSKKLKELMKNDDEKSDK